MQNNRFGRGRRAALWFALAALTWLVVACEDTAAYTTGAYAVPVVTSAALQPIVEQAQVDRYLSAIEAEDTLRRYHAEQTATAEARKAAEWQATMTAEARMWEITATAAAIQWEATATAAAVNATATAEALARERAWEDATATAVAIRTENDTRMTVTAWQVTQTAAAAEFAADEALRAEQLERERLATQRERIVYPVRAYGPWLILLCAAGMLIWGAYRFIRVGELRAQAVPRDARGDAPLIPVRLPGGGIVWLDLDIANGPVTVITGDGEVSQPMLAAPEVQERTKARDQAIDLVHRGLPSQTPRRVTPQQAARLAQTNPAPQLTGPVQIIDPAQVRKWLQEVEPQALSGALIVEGEVYDVA